MKKVILARHELAYPETLGTKLRDLLMLTEDDDGELHITVSEWATDDDGIIRSGGPLGDPMGTKSPVNNF